VKSKKRLIRPPTTQASDTVSNGPPSECSKRFEMSEGHREASDRYSFLASFSNAMGWRDATFRFTVKLAWVGMFRSEQAQCIYDSRAGGDLSMAGVRSRDLFD